MMVMVFIERVRHSLFVLGRITLGRKHNCHARGSRKVKVKDVVVEDFKSILSLLPFTHLRND